MKKRESLQLTRGGVFAENRKIGIQQVVLLISNIGTQSVQELFFCDSIRRTVYSNDLVTFFWLRCIARKKLGIYDVHTCTMLHR